MVAPGTALREGIDNVIHASTGALIVIGEPDEISYLFSGGLKLDVDYTPALIYQVAKMDGAIVLDPEATKISWANVQLMPDPTIHSSETGTRHRTAERVSKQTKALVIAISARREVVTIYLDGRKYILQDIPTVLSKANQGLATMEKYRLRLDRVSARLTTVEMAGAASLHDVLTVLQRAELLLRTSNEVERYIIELGAEGRLIEMQLEETAVGVLADRVALIRDYAVDDSEATLDEIARPSSAPSRIRSCSTSAGWPSCSATTARPNPARPPRLGARLPRPRADPAPAAAGRREGDPPLRQPRGDPRGHRRRARCRRRRRRGPAPPTSARASTASASPRSSSDTRLT